MKSKTVASILRHVASKIPSSAADAGSVPIDAPVAPTPEATEKEPKRARKTRQATHEEDLGEEGATTGPNEDERLEMLYDTIGWPLGKKYGHPYDAFKLALTSVLSSLSTIGLLPDQMFLTGSPRPCLLRYPHKFQNRHGTY